MFPWWADAFPATKQVFTQGIPSIISSDWGTHLFWEKISLKESLAIPLELSQSFIHPETSGKVEKTNGVFTLKIVTFAETIGLPWLKVLPYWLFVVFLLGNINSFHMRQLLAGQWIMLHNFLLIPCWFMLVWLASLNLECLVLKPIIQKLKMFPRFQSKEPSAIV